MPIDITDLNRRMSRETIGLLKFDVTGFNAVYSQYRDRERQMLAAANDLVLNESQRLLDLLQEEAPKKTGAFARGLRVETRTSWTSDLPMSQIRLGGEHAFLLPFIVKGTKPHTIPTGGSAAQMAKGYPLHFYWENGPRGPGDYFFWSVRHPGTKPNDFITRAKNRWMPAAEQRFRQAGIELRKGSYVHWF